MKMRQVLPVAMLAMATVGCNIDDGVPKVDVQGTIVVARPASVSNGLRLSETRVRMIQLPDGKQMPLRDFLRKYCFGNVHNGTCQRGEKILQLDAPSGPVQQLPESL